MSALGLKRALGLGSYETAWAWLHKFRRAMVRPGRDRLGGELEVDETFVGGTDPRPGRSPQGKAIVAIAVEALAGGACGRVRLARIPNTSALVLTEFVRGAATPGSVIYTDRWQGYSGLRAAGFLHQPTSVAASGDPAHVVMPRAHRIASLLKRWQLGTHQSAVRPTSSTITSTSSPSASTDVDRTTSACSSTGSSSRPSSCPQPRSRRSSAESANPNANAQRPGCPASRI